MVCKIILKFSNIINELNPGTMLLLSTSQLRCPSIHIDMIHPAGLKLS